MPRPKLRAKRRAVEVDKVPTRCCVVCYNDFTPFPFDSEKWNSNMIKNFYIALNIPWSGSEDEDGDDEEVIYLPFCPQCHTKVSVMQTYQIELQNLQSKFNSVRNDVAFTVVQSIGKHSKDGPIVQIRQQIFEKWKLTFEEKQKVESIGEEVGLEYIAHEPSSRPHVCGIHFCNCQRMQTAEASGTATKELDKDNLQSLAFVEPGHSNIGNGNFLGTRKPQPQVARLSTMNGGSMPILSKMVKSPSGSPIKFPQGAQRHSTSTPHVPNLIPFQGPFPPRATKTFDGKFPMLPNMSSSASILNVSTVGGSKTLGRQKLQPPHLTYVGSKNPAQRAGSLKFPGSLSKFVGLGSTGQLQGAKATVPSHIVPKTPNRLTRKVGVRTGTPTARQRLLMQGPARNAYRARISGNLKQPVESMIIEPEIGSLEAQPKYGKRKMSTEYLNFVEPPAKLARGSGSLASPSKRSLGRSKTSNGNFEPESQEDNEAETIPRTRGSPRSPIKSPTESFFSLTQDDNGLYPCQWCTKSFRSMSRLRRHGSFEHPEKLNIQCEYESCNKGFSSDVAYKRHMQHQHKISLDGFKTMICPRCRRCFVKVSSFRTHLKSHGLTITEIAAVLDAAENEYGGEEPIGDTTTVYDTIDDPEQMEAGIEEEAFVTEPIAKIKRKITIQRPFGIRKRKRRGKGEAPKLVAPPTTSRRRSQKPQAPLDPVRKSSRQRGVQIDAGLPMYPAPKPRSRNKGIEGETQEEPDGVAQTEAVDTNEEEGTTEAKITVPADPINTTISEIREMESKESVDVADVPKTDDSTTESTNSTPTDQKVYVQPKDEIPREPVEPESNLDDSFVRGAKSDVSLSTSPIQMAMNPESLFSSTPMAPRLDFGKPSLDCSMDNNHTLHEHPEGSTFNISCDSAEADAEDNADKTSASLNTTYTLDAAEEVDGDGDSEKKEITQLEDTQQGTES